MGLTPSQASVILGSGLHGIELACYARSNTFEGSMAALEQQIQDLETKISVVEAKAEQAEAEGDLEGLRFLREKEQQLRRKEELLREEKARKEAAQQSERSCCLFAHR